MTFVELPEAAWCCGSAGIYNITQPEQSDKLLERKVRHILATGAAVVATANPGCHLQIVRGLATAGAQVEVRAPVSLLARAYRNEAAQLQPVPPGRQTGLRIRVNMGVGPLSGPATSH